jgi:predicted DsbA family dithiol-disulfide isomerase
MIPADNLMLIVYGDFNCPYSTLASYRVDRLLREGIADVEWRAVQHDADMPAAGVPVDAHLRKELEREIDEIREETRDDEQVPLRIMKVRPNTAVSSCVFSTLEADEAHFRRREFFDAVWVRGRNISDSDELGEFGAEGSLSRRDRQWQAEWSATKPLVVPRLHMPDGDAHGGVEALRQLATLAYG